jgi:transcriptional regulator with XRE-family HTH domain
MRGQTASVALTGRQLRAARAVLDWSGRELADAAGVSFSTVRRAEEDGATTIRVESLTAIRSALETAGIEFGRFLDGDEGLRWSAGQSVPAGVADLQTP